MPLLSYIIKRSALIVPTVLLVIWVTFTLTYIVPVDPISVYIFQGQVQMEITPEMIAAIKHELGLDQPYHMQFLYYLNRLIHGDFGLSYRTRGPIITELSKRFMATLDLALCSIVVSTIIGIPLGVMSAVKRNKIMDHFTRILALAGLSIPGFWLALILQLVFYASLGWLPASGRFSANPPTTITGLFFLDSLITGNLKALGDGLSHIILPTISLSLGSIAWVCRIARSSMLDVLQKDYVRTVRAYGFKERIVVFKYALRNALIPVVTVIGLSFGASLRGSVLIEAIYDWPGMGQYAYQSMLSLDYPAVAGVSLIICIVYMVANLAVDVLYTYVDPRVKY